MSDQLYEAYVEAREKSQAIHDACVSRSMILEEIDADEIYCEAVAKRELAYKKWMHSCGGEWPWEKDYA